MTVVIDPAVRIISDTAQIFVLHPGRAKRYMEDFAKENAVFLDVPGVEFAEPPLAKSETTQRLLRMSRRIRAWKNHGAPAADAPSRDPLTYKAGGSTENAKFLYEVEDLYADAKAGDLVIVPGRGYGRTLLIGEFMKDFDPGFVVYPPREGGEKFPARRVHWLHAQASKTDFSARLIRLLQNRQAIIRITDVAQRHEVYERTYGDYVWGATSGNLVRVTATEVDLNDLSRAADLTNYFAAQYLALKKGDIATFLSLPFEQALETYYDKSYFGGVGIEIHSPGFFARLTHKPAMASYISVMLALSGQGISAQEAATAVVANSANTVVSICDMELEADIRRTMEVYANMTLWFDEVCPKSVAAKSNVGLQSEVSVSQVPDAEAPSSSGEAFGASAAPKAP